MKKLIGSTAAKATAIMLFFLLLITLALSVVGVVVLGVNDAYFDDGRSLTNTALDNGVQYYKSYVYMFADELVINGTLDTVAFDDLFSEDNCNFFFTVYDPDSGEILMTNYTDTSPLRAYDEAPIYLRNTYYEGYYDEYGAWIPNDDYEERVVMMTSGIRSELTAKDRVYYYATYTDLLIQNRYLLIALIPVCAVVCIAIIIFLMCAAGHRTDCDEIALNVFDRIPFDVYLAGLGLLLLALAWLLLEGLHIDGDVTVFILIGACVPITLTLLLTTATRIKSGTFLKNTLVYRLFSLIGKGGRGIGKAALKLPLYYKTAAVWCVLSMIELIVVLSVYETADLLVFWFIEKLLLTPVIIWAVINMQTLRKAGKSLADGDITHTVDTRGMLPMFKEHGEHLNGIGEGLAIAVEKGTRSERMRAELITNVSHDIKTPLTSIINYVGLLKRDGLTSESAPEYLQVLDRQSVRLKKLTEDLIEASKASTGNIKVTMAPLDANILLQQAAAEYEERLQARDLTVVTKLDADPAVIHADGRLLWRVFDNLLSNIAKYAKNDTRVYLSTHTVNDTVYMVFRNISGEQLDISADELTERFVRGDTSRNTEGSGLGLSIAKSLTHLQGGTFDIHIDGDLFKIIISFQRSVSS